MQSVLLAVRHLALAVGLAAAGMSIVILSVVGMLLRLGAAGYRTLLVSHAAVGMAIIILAAVLMLARLGTAGYLALAVGLFPVGMPIIGLPTVRMSLGLGTALHRTLLIRYAIAQMTAVAGLTMIMLSRNVAAGCMTWAVGRRISRGLYRRLRRCRCRRWCRRRLCIGRVTVRIIIMMPAPMMAVRACYRRRQQNCERYRKRRDYFFQIHCTSPVLSLQ